ncbi:FAD:protein FMN transferase [Undibacterium sp.]|jgi:thiamine biosynthesis lipoprotein|uniref:FAD:protein FMN transferase n=1 Tax=Undibacterium sp. TaxID=1914977 RepID=UPI002C5A9870|nr:FAD:protein FMN transferase [Undibacterium sp.]HTD03135.1 FAD:protein FMN transferase [Undibacterium sp.]
MKRRAQPWLGTLVEISIADAMADTALAAAFELAFQQLALVHRLMSFHAADSDLARINRAPVGSIVEIDPHTRTVLQAAMQVTAASAGLFDIRIASRLVDWDLLPPAGQQLPAYQPQQLSFSLTPEGKLQKLGADWLDLGGIAKGYAVDLAIQSLQQSGVQNACVNAGGDLRVIGDSASEIMLRDPASPASMAYKISLQNQALATSASYFSLQHTERGSHSALVNGQTGEAMLDAVSVSVSAAQCMLADALTKVVMASGNAKHACLAQFGAHALII